RDEHLGVGVGGCVDVGQYLAAGLARTDETNVGSCCGPHDCRASDGSGREAPGADVRSIGGETGSLLSPQFAWSRLPSCGCRPHYRGDGCSTEVIRGAIPSSAIPRPIPSRTGNFLAPGSSQGGTFGSAGPSGPDICPV